MQTSDSRVQPNLMECACKVIDGEAVIINLSNGTYYSLDKAGATIWEQLCEGRTLAQVVETLTTLYEVGADQAQRDVARLVQELLAERLLVAATENGADANGNGAHGHATNGNGAHGSGARGSAAAPADRLPYEAPALTVYRDMADLLALDPPMPRLEDVVWSEPDGGTTTVRTA